MIHAARIFFALFPVAVVTVTLNGFQRTVIETSISSSMHQCSYSYYTMGAIRSVRYTHVLLNNLSNRSVDHVRTHVGAVCSHIAQSLESCVYGRHFVLCVGGGWWGCCVMFGYISGQIEYHFVLPNKCSKDFP